MFHTLRFRDQYISYLKRPGKSLLERVEVAEGCVLSARVRPWVKETARGPVEVADLDCDGGVLLAVPFAVVEFVEKEQ